MLPKERLAQIAEMENLLDESTDFLAEIGDFLEKWQAFLPKIKKLEQYYFAGDWRDDYEAYEQGEIPKEMPCGVLSQDLVFNASAEHQDLAIEYLKVITMILDRQNYS
ncbi:hypothetical protein BKK54_06620 [Rodentibacter genomosp. 1]|uniref:DUF4298 domain-containing protein n=1 Tax=Rodentibacter genomosp. 1 TaxID=1908264 RepID=A0A1V3J5Z1_9PAST|nr:DUF4298 domain-containing protein [Rodentibacter genomosp. 1]OOF50315.1 hypothetical protein BKK54_06620 [Rodentibacter genomosp. 1]